MKVFQRVMLAFVIVGSTVVFTGCQEGNTAGVPAGTVPPDAPKNSQDAMKSMGNMAPTGAPGPGAPKATPKK